MDTEQVMMVCIFGIFILLITLARLVYFLYIYYRYLHASEEVLKWRQHN